jgi:phosphoglycerate dehydrogenase-like enzyme
MHKILVASRSFGRGASGDQLDELFRRHGLSPEFSSLEAIGDRIEQFEGIIIGTESAGAQLFRQANALRAIIKYGVGTDNIDRQAAEQRGIRVLSLPGINSDTVAEMALGLMFASARRIAAGDRMLRQEKADRPLGQPVCGQTLGVIGTGAIGTALVRIVSGLAMEVLAYDIRENPELVDLGVRYLPLEDLLGLADFVSIHLPLNEQTFHRIGAPELALMKNTAVLVNTSRGGVVDEKALYEALVRGTIGGAALDVLETKPPWKSRLVGLENTVCTPHIAAYTDETLRKMDAACLSALSEALEASRKEARQEEKDGGSR